MRAGAEVYPPESGRRPTKFSSHSQVLTSDSRVYRPISGVGSFVSAQSVRRYLGLLCIMAAALFARINGHQRALNIRSSNAHELLTVAGNFIK